MTLRWIASAVAAAALGLVVPVSALAAEVRSGDTVTVGPNEVVTDDLYAFGANVVVQGTVQGDVITAGSTVTVTGHVTGSVMAAGNNVTVSGPVDGSVRLAGSTVSVGGPVGTDLLVAGSTAAVNPPTTVGRDLLAAAGTVLVQAPVARNVTAGAGALTLGSSVGGAVNANVSELVLTEGANITGPVAYVSPNEAVIRNGARLAQAPQRTPPPSRDANPWEPAGIDILGWLRGFVGVALFGGLLMLAFPRAAETAVATVERRWLASLGLGFALVVGLPILALLVFGLGLFVGGWWIGLFVLALYAVVLVTGYVTVAGWLGMAALRAAHAEARPLLGLLFGLLLVGLALAIPIVGGLAGFTVTVIGVGALSLSGYEAYQRRRTLPAVQSEPPAPLRAAA